MSFCLQIGVVVTDSVRVLCRENQNDNLVDTDSELTQRNQNVSGTRGYDSNTEAQDGLG